MKKLLIILIPFLFTGCCDSDMYEESTIITADLIDIKRDDESDLHILIKYPKTGFVESYHDVYNYKIIMGDYVPRVEMELIQGIQCNGQEFNLMHGNRLLITVIPL